jgi:hypothetical protein
MRQCGQKILVQRIAFAIDAGLFVHFQPESGGAVRRGRSIRQSRWPVRPRRRKARTARPRAGHRGAARQRGLGRRIAVKDQSGGHGPDAARPFRQGCATACRTRYHRRPAGCPAPEACARRASRSVSVRPSQVASRSIPANSGEGLGHAHHVRAWHRGRRSHIAEAQLSAARRLGGQPQEIGAIVHQHAVILPGAIPFQHGEFGAVQRARVRGCARHGQRRRSASRPPPAAFSSQIRGWYADTSAAPCPSLPIWRVSKPCRCASFPGLIASAAGSTSRKSCAPSQSRIAAWMRLRAKSSGAAVRHGGRGPTTGFRSVCVAPRLPNRLRLALRRETRYGTPSLPALWIAGPEFEKQARKPP